MKNEWKSEYTKITDTHTHAHTHIYIYIYIYISCRAGSTDIPDPLSPLFPIVHLLRQVFWTTSQHPVSSHSC